VSNASDLMAWAERDAEAAGYFILQLAESQLTQRLFAQIIRRIERLAWHPT